MAFIAKLKEFTVSLIFFVAIVCKLSSDGDNYDLLYIIAFFFVVTVLWRYSESMRRESILRKLKDRHSLGNGTILESEYEYGLYVLLQISQDALISETDYRSSHAYGELIDLLLAHSSSCSDTLCICGEMEKFYDLLKIGKLHNNQDVFPIMGKQFSHFKAVI